MLRPARVMRTFKVSLITWKSLSQVKKGRGGKAAAQGHSSAGQVQGLGFNPQNLRNRTQCLEGKNRNRNKTTSLLFIQEMLKATLAQMVETGRLVWK